MNVTRTLWIRNAAIVSAIIVYLLFAAAVVVGQSRPTRQETRDLDSTAAKILISGKPVEQVQAPPKPNQSSARIIIQSAPVSTPQKESSLPASAGATNSKSKPVVVDPKRKLVTPVRPGAIPKTRVNPSKPAMEKTQGPQLKSASNSKTRPVPQVSPRLENVKLANPPIVETGQLKPMTRSSDRPDFHPPSRSAIRISDLPVVDKSKLPIESQKQITSQAIYYPSTSEPNPIATVNGSMKIEQEPKAKTETRFQDREKLNMLQPVLPAPIEMPGKDPEQKRPAIDPRLQEFLSSGEFLHDGGDRNRETVVGSDWSVQGLDTEDTVGHFDTVDGDRIVVPSNRVSIYAPRFSAVQKIDGLVSANSIEHMANVEDRLPTHQSGTFDVAANSKKHVATVRNIGKRSASALQDQTRGMTVDNTHHLAMNSNVVSSAKIHQFLLTGRLNNTEKAFLATAMQSAVTWSADMEVKIAVKNIETKTVHDVKSANETVTVDPVGKKSKLRVVKMADKRAAQPGEEIEFMIRFDNVGEEVIGNVTVLDNLTGRLEYIEGSASCSVKADLITSQNDAQSTQLRWEIIDPLEIGKGGVIKFKCRVR